MKQQRKKDSSFSSICQLVEETQRLARQAESLYTPEVGALIAEGSLDAKRIEHLLDGLLDFAFNPEVLLLYKKLCRYYYFIDPRATVSYVNAYREMWDEDNPPPSQKKRRTG